MPADFLRLGEGLSLSNCLPDSRPTPSARPADQLVAAAGFDTLRSWCMPAQHGTVLATRTGSAPILKRYRPRSWLCTRMQSESALRNPTFRSESRAPRGRDQAAVRLARSCIVTASLLL